MFSRALRLALALASLLLCAVARADGGEQASSRVDGVFLTFSSKDSDGIGAYLDTAQSKAYVDRFRDACAAKKRIWAHGSQSVFRCAKFVGSEESGDTTHRLKLEISDKRDSKSAMIFSLAPTRAFKATTRPLESAEVTQLASIYKSKSLNQAISKSIKAGNYKILDIKNGAISIYVIKWKHVSEESGIANDYFLVLNRQGSQYSSAGHFYGQIIRFLDINQDGIPEVQLDINCDGTCAAVHSIYKNTLALASVSLH